MYDAQTSVFRKLCRKVKIKGKRERERERERREVN